MPNPFADDYGAAPAASAPGAPSPPISGNPFEMENVVSAPHPVGPVAKAADFLKAASNTGTFGMRDRLEGAVDWATGAAPSYSEGVDRAVADSRMRRERSPLISTAGDVAGGAAQAFIPGAGALGRGVAAGLGGNTAARMAGYGFEGGAFGAAQGVGQTYSGNPEDYAKAGLTGAAVGAAVGAPFGKFADVTPRSMATVPNSVELKASSQGRYDATHQIPVAWDAHDYWGGIDALRQQLLQGTGGFRGGTNPYRSPTVFGTLDIATAGRGSVPPGATATVNPKEIDSIRQQLTGVAEPGAGHARRWLDNYMQDPSGVVRGTQADRDQIARLLTDARGDWRSGKRTQTIEEQNQYAADRAAVANSGKNVANTYGQKLTGLLSPTSREGNWYNPAEKADIRATAKRDDIEGFKRTLANMMGGGGGWAGGSYAAGGAGAGYLTGDLLPAAAGVGVPLAGMMLKRSSNQNMISEANALADRMAMNSPLYRERAANAPVVPGPGLGNFAEGSRNAVTNQLLNQLKIRGYMDQGDPNAP